MDLVKPPDSPYPEDLENPYIDHTERATLVRTIVKLPRHDKKRIVCFLVALVIFIVLALLLINYEQNI